MKEIIIIIIIYVVLNFSPIYFVTVNLEIVRDLNRMVFLDSYMRYVLQRISEIVEDFDNPPVSLSVRPIYLFLLMLLHSHSLC